MLDPIRLSIDPLPSSAGDFIDRTIVRAHCNVCSGQNPYNDDLIILYLKAAILWAEGEMHRTIVSRLHRWVLRSFPCDLYQEIRLPRGKTQSVSSIQYKDGAGNTTTLTGPSASPPGSDFQQDLASEDGGVLMPPLTGSWPSADLTVPDPVVIQFTAGWARTELPADIAHALLFYVSDAFELRGTDDIDNGRYKDLRESKISGYRLHRIYAPQAPYYAAHD